jgi:hypothetical protein
MIKFLRKIRKNLLNEGKTSRYFKYAVGEILLVVIGILIALQINNWNEHRKDNIHELEVIAGLYGEIRQNLDLTIEYKEESDKRLIAIKSLLNITTKELEQITDEQLNRSLLLSVISNGYIPLVSKLDHLLSKESLESYQSQNLISLLNVYSNSINTIKIQSDSDLEKFSNKQVPLFYKNISVKNIMHQREPKEISKSKNVVHLKLFVQSLEFENVYADLYATVKKNTQYLDANIKLMQQIIQYIEENYPSVISTKPNHE